jgi:hypothetical protein
MKTLVSKLSIVTLIIFFASTSFSYSKKDPRRTNNGNNSAGITFVVNIDAIGAGSHCYTYIVSVRDENGNYVDGSIVYTPFVQTYVFHESGPVSGTRSAHLERIDYSCSNSCNNVYYTQPDHAQANFRNGRTYVFKLEPSSVPSNN